MTTAMISFDQLMSNKYFTWVRIGQFVVAISIYCTLLLLPNVKIPVGPTDFGLHATGNALLMMSIWVASGGRYKALGPLLFVMPFSVLTEVAQGFTDNRTPQLIDVAANFTGAAIGFLLCQIMALILMKIFPNKV